MICCFGEYVCWETNTISYHPDHFSPRLSPSPPAVPTLESFFPSLPHPDPDFVRRPSSAAFPSLPAAYLPPHIPELLLRAGVERNPGPARRRKAKTPVVDPSPVRSPDPRAPPLDARGANASGSGSGSPNSPRKMRPLDSREALVTLSGGRSRSRDPLAFANPEGRHCSVVVTLSLGALVALEDGANHLVGAHPLLLQALERTTCAAQTRAIMRKCGSNDPTAVFEFCFGACSAFRFGRSVLVSCARCSAATSESWEEASSHPHTTTAYTTTAATTSTTSATTATTTATTTSTATTITAADTGLLPLLPSLSSVDEFEAGEKRACPNCGHFTRRRTTEVPFPPALLMVNVVHIDDGDRDCLPVPFSVGEDLFVPFWVSRQRLPNTDKGHFITSCLRGSPPQWWSCDTERVSPAPFPVELPSRVVAVCYRRQPRHVAATLLPSVMPVVVVASLPVVPAQQHSFPKVDEPIIIADPRSAIQSDATTLPHPLAPCPSAPPSPITHPQPDTPSPPTIAHLSTVPQPTSEQFASHPPAVPDTTALPTVVIPESSSRPTAPENIVSRQPPELSALPDATATNDPPPLTTKEDDDSLQHLSAVVHESTAAQQLPPSTADPLTSPRAGKKAPTKSNKESLKPKSTSINPKRSQSATPVKKTRTLPPVKNSNKSAAPAQAPDTMGFHPSTTEEHDSHQPAHAASLESTAVQQSPPPTENSPTSPSAGKKAPNKSNKESLKSKLTQKKSTRSHSATPVKMTRTLSTATASRRSIAPVPASDADDIQPSTTEEHDSRPTSPIVLPESAVSPQTPPSTENSPILPCAGQKALIKTNAESLKTKNTSIDPKRSHSATPVKKTCTLPTAAGQRQLIAPVQTSDASNIQPPTTEEHDSILTSPIATTESAVISRSPSSAENSPKSKNRATTPRPKNLPPQADPKRSHSALPVKKRSYIVQPEILCSCRPLDAPPTQGRHDKHCNRHGLKPTKKLPQPDATEGDFPLPISQPASPARPISYVDPVRAAAESAAPDLTPNLLPIPLHDIFCAQIRTVESVPRRATQAVSSAFDFCLRRSNSALGWWRLLAFAKLVLCAFPSRGGGNRKAQADIELRARRFVEGDFAALWSEAKGTIRTRQSRGGAPITFPVDLDSLPHHLQSALGTAVDVDNLSEVALHRAVSRARLGQYGRAASTLSAATIAPDTDVNLQALMDKHPHSPEPILPPPPATERILPLGKGKLKKLLSAFAPGTAPGPSGFRHQFLVDIMRRPGCSIWPQMGDFIARIANGDVPIEVRPFMFGARLIALLKKDDTLRPIACGEFFRRMAGKHLCS